MDDAKSGPGEAGGVGDAESALSGADLIAHLEAAPLVTPEAGEAAGQAEEERSPSVPGRAMEQPGGGVLVTLGEWLTRVRHGRRVEAVAVAMSDVEGTGVRPEAHELEVHSSWSEDADGFVVEDRSEGSVVQTWVPAAVSPQGDVKAAARRPPGGRRRRANVDGGRRHKHKVLVTPSEEARLQVLARKKGITIPRMLVESAFAPDSQTVSERRVIAAQLMELDRVLSGVAVNMNQIARATNTGYELPADFAKAQAEARSILAKIDEALALLNALNKRDLGE